MASAWGNSWGISSGGGPPPVVGGGVGFISEGLSRALLTVAFGKDENLQFAVSSVAAFTNLVGFVLHQDLITDPVYDNSERVASQTSRAYLKGPVFPKMALGYRIRDNTQTPPLVWAVEGVVLESQQIVTLTRQERVGVAGPDRGASA